MLVERLRCHKSEIFVRAEEPDLIVSTRQISRVTPYRSFVLLSVSTHLHVFYKTDRPFE